MISPMDARFNERPMPRIMWTTREQVLHSDYEGPEDYLSKIWNSVQDKDKIDVNMLKYLRRFDETKLNDLKLILSYADENNEFIWCHCPQIMKHLVTDADLCELQAICEGLGVKLTCQSLSLYLRVLSDRKGVVSV